jgi:hypothetical protein
MPELITSFFESENNAPPPIIGDSAPRLLEIMKETKCRLADVRKARTTDALRNAFAPRGLIRWWFCRIERSGVGLIAL